jgi:prepilin signal peptidase PulO-like enzyme (type II secretory pathway)
MYQEKRPTCITVIGWAWIIIGGMMFFSAIMALFSSVMINQMSQSNPESLKNIPAIFRYIRFIAIGQIGIAILGLVSGINFLKFKMWARNVLEVLSWLLLLFIVGFMIYWEYNWISMASGYGPRKNI